MTSLPTSAGTSTSTPWSSPSTAATGWSSPGRPSITSSATATASSRARSNMNTTDTMVGWVITADHDGDEARIGYGQTIKHADDTAESFAAVFGRQIYMATSLTADAIP